MSSVSATSSGSNVWNVTATLALNGDPYMTHTCTSFADCNGPNGNYPSNVYNAFTVKTAHFGVVPLQLTSFNASTGAATFKTLDQWNAVNDNRFFGGLDADVNALTTIYAAEMVTVFDGAGITATNIHIENSSGVSGIVATRLINSWYGYGGPRTNTLTDIINNYDPSGVFANRLNPAFLAAFYAQQTFDYITVNNAPLVINSLIGGGSDYLTASVGYSKFVWRSDAESNSMRLNTRPFTYYIAGDQSFTGNYKYAGTPGFGYGYFDTLLQTQISFRLSLRCVSHGGLGTNTGLGLPSCTLGNTVHRAIAIRYPAVRPGDHQYGGVAEREHYFWHL